MNNPLRLLGFVLVASSVLSAQTPPSESAYDLTTSTGVLHGTLRMPTTNPRPPVVLIIAGSGPTDRDGNSGTQVTGNTYRLLAEALAQKGIATLRYDKRGIAASRPAGAPEAQMRFDIGVDDASAWVEKLRNDVRFKSIVIAGHSEGSLIGMIAARQARTDGFVSISGVGFRASDLLRTQLKPQLAALPALAAENESIIKSLEAGHTVTPLPSLVASVPALASLWRPSVQPYLMSWFRYSPTAELAMLKRPVLILQGTTDIQVSVDDAKALAAAKPDATLTIIDGMNHVLKAAPADRLPNIATYTKADLPLVAEVPDAIATYVNSLSLPQHPAVERKSPRALTVGNIGGGRISIEYGQLGVRDRKIWGTLVPWNKWWMAGADEATTMTTSEAIQLGGPDGLVVPAGDYTLFAMPTSGSDPKEPFMLLVNKQTYQFHTQYNASRDLGGVGMSLKILDQPVELLRWDITAAGPNSGVLKFAWDNREYAVNVSVASKK